jgi:hypothetical protein
MREYNFFPSFKMTLKNSFFVGINICKNFTRQNLISNRLVIILFYEAYAKKSKK